MANIHLLHFLQLIWRDHYADRQLFSKSTEGQFDHNLGGMHTLHRAVKKSSAYERFQVIATLYAYGSLDKSTSF